MKSNLSRNLLYLSFHNSIKKVYGINKLVRKKDLVIKLGRQFLVPKKLRELAIQELIRMNLIKEKDDHYVLILEGHFDLENNSKEFYDKFLFSCS